MGKKNEQANAAAPASTGSDPASLAPATAARDGQSAPVKERLEALVKAKIAAGLTPETALEVAKAQLAHDARARRQETENRNPPGLIQATAQPK